MKNTNNKDICISVLFNIILKNQYLIETIIGNWLSQRKSKKERTRIVDSRDKVRLFYEKKKLFTFLNKDHLAKRNKSEEKIILT